jgi:hypothetical protein
MCNVREGKGETVLRPSLASNLLKRRRKRTGECPHTRTRGESGDRGGEQRRGGVRHRASPMLSATPTPLASAAAASQPPSTCMSYKALPPPETCTTAGFCSPHHSQSWTGAPYTFPSATSRRTIARGERGSLDGVEPCAGPRKAQHALVRGRAVAPPCPAGSGLRCRRRTTRRSGGGGPSRGGGRSAAGVRGRDRCSGP